MSTIQVEDISHVRFTAPDLTMMRAFLEDFGLVCFEDAGILYARGRDGSPFAHVTQLGAPAFVALGLRAADETALQRLAEHTRSRVEPFDAPGGGQVVRLRDPDGNIVEVVAGQARAPVSTITPSAPLNSPNSRRRIRAAVRVAKGASCVHRLGHAVLNVGDFRRAERWYKEHFGLITSHEIEVAPRAAIGAFLRCDRGEQPTDHHSLFLLQLPAAPGPLNHVAFEVAGLDDLMAGHAHLKAQGRKPAWGVGRHKLGSQIFDYWKDPWGHELEHWTDGDLLTAADEPETASFLELIEVQWGAAFPPLAPSPDLIAKTSGGVSR